MKRQLFLGIGLLVSLIFLIWNNIRYAKQIVRLNYQVASLLGTQVRTVIKTRKINVPVEIIKEKIIYVPQEGRVVIEPKEKNKQLEDVVNIKIKNKGLNFSPGLQLIGPKSRIGIDFKLVYWNRWGIVGGITFPFLKIAFPESVIAPTVGVSYRLDRLKYIKNTELSCGYIYLTLIPVYCGFRINL